MNLRASKIGGASILTILGVICLGTFLIAAFTWSTQSTMQKGPQEVSLGTPTVNEWNTADFFKANLAYDITLPVIYNFHSGSQITYTIEVIATAGQGTIELSDFTVSISGIIGVTLGETSPGTWITGTITVQSSTPSDEVTIRIMPTENAMDLGQVSFAISAMSVA